MHSINFTRKAGSVDGNTVAVAVVVEFKVAVSGAVAMGTVVRDAVEFIASSNATVEVEVEVEVELIIGAETEAEADDDDTVETWDSLVEVEVEVEIAGEDDDTVGTARLLPFAVLLPLLILLLLLLLTVVEAAALLVRVGGRLLKSIP
jgi:hypothetical protein